MLCKIINCSKLAFTNRLKIKLELQLLFPTAVTDLRPKYNQLMGDLKNQLGVAQDDDQVTCILCESIDVAYLASLNRLCFLHE